MERKKSERKECKLGFHYIRCRRYNYCKHYDACRIEYTKRKKIERREKKRYAKHRNGCLCGAGARYIIPQFVVGHATIHNHAVKRTYEGWCTGAFWTCRMCGTVHLHYIHWEE